MLGHESFGQVLEVGEKAMRFKPGDYVVATVRRPGGSIYDWIGSSDVTTDDCYFERGISNVHGFLTEFYVDHEDYVVKIPQGLKDVGVLLEPMTVVEQGIAQAYSFEIDFGGRTVWRLLRLRWTDAENYGGAACLSGTAAARPGGDDLLQDVRAEFECRPRGGRWRALGHRPDAHNRQGRHQGVLRDRGVAASRLIWTVRPSLPRVVTFPGTASQML